MAAKEDFVNKHALVPKHSKLGDKQTKELLTNYKITKDQLPKILLKDSALKSLDVNAGDIIKIERNSATAGKTTYFRIVVEE
jgi:DNA-directed RNA polymerase subunit H